MLEVILLVSHICKYTTLILTPPHSPAMNEIWVSWIDPENKPVRACVEAPMASPDILFEVMVIAKK